MANSKVNIKEFLDADERKSLLRLLTAGSVDDGKSTLIGRLLFDSKKLYEDQLQALERDSKRVGNAGAGQIDYALLLDGLKAEREEGITIDVAYRYFSTNQRKFIIADTPGHEQDLPASFPIDKEILAWITPASAARTRCTQPFPPDRKSMPPLAAPE